jgi:hypothetical protein
MKAVVLLLAGLFGIFTAQRIQAQGYVAFANTTDTRVLTNDMAGGFGFMSGVNAYRIGLYVGALGSTENALQLVGLATNSPLPGRFTGGNPFYLPAEYSTGAAIAFQVRVWSFSGGMSYEQALVNGSPFLARTSVGYVTPGLVPEPPPMLFGQGPGQIYGPQVSLSSPGLALLAIEVPEPSTIAIMIIALVLGNRYAHGKRKAADVPASRFVRN